MPAGSAVGDSVSDWLANGGDTGQDDFTIADGVPILAFYDPGQGDLADRARISSLNGVLRAQNVGEPTQVLAGVSDLLTSTSIGLTFQNGWQDYSVTSTTYRLYFWKMGNIAFASGLFKHSNLADAGTHELATLPVQWRPSAGTMIFPSMNNLDSTSELRVSSGGGINLQTGHGLSGSSWVSMVGAYWFTNTTAL